MFFDVLYVVLSSMSSATYNIVAAVWKIEEASIHFMMTCFLFGLRLVCHPVLILPMLIGAFYTLRNFWQRRRRPLSGISDGCALTTNVMSPNPRPFGRSPRLRSYRSLGNNTTRSYDSFDGSEEERPLN
ncbi:uncharacterized protein Dwil_GK19489 [Drosophila willistoni]|uniref:Uncharacterized protein n=1 Tax=Drosophila willistoni TaxID=7260 RepID=B4MNX2_DROWI|nr:uncharacterized protein LOC6639834 [Drosophila willistoni]EDW73811.1 uncharacterized protein Dwil_GK19489 [Drosophila willistoni]